MTPEQDYQATQGTVIGEIRHEVYLKYGKEAYETAQYGWNSVFAAQDIHKMYNLVNSSPVQFLIATITYPMVDITPINPSTNKKLDVPIVFGPDFSNPSNLHLEWTDANIPFLPKEEVDKLGITYNLP